MREEFLGEMSTTNYFALILKTRNLSTTMFKRILFGEKALLAMKKSNGLTVIDGRLIPVVENGKTVWEFAPYNRLNPKRHKMKVLEYLPEGWIKMGVRRLAIFSSASNKISPEEVVEQLKHDICAGLDKVLMEGKIEDMKDYLNVINRKV